MGEMITKPDANPILIAILQWFTAGAVGYFMIGQTKKAIASIVIWLIGGMCTFGLLSFGWMLVSTYDAYLLAGKLAAGESITPNQNGLSFLDAVFKD